MSRQPDHTTDKLLWQSIRKSNKSAYSQVYKKYVGSLRMYGAKLSFDQGVIKDAIQDVFIKIWDCRTTLPEVENVKLYLLKSLRNRLINLWKKEKTRKNNASYDAVDQISIESMIIMQELKKEQLVKLHFHLQNLPIRQREVIHLKYFQNLKTAEIAEMLNINSQSVSNSIYRGLNTLKFKFRTVSNAITRSRADEGLPFLGHK